MSALSESSTIRISLVIAFSSVIVGATWWASAIESRVSGSEQKIQAVQNEARETNEQLSELNATMREIKVLLKERGR